ncbi:hypothetical protein EPN44_05850 [bacterium]|nr:MAG: hypothetical protein EPN44_05850 [bacterium]
MRSFSIRKGSLTVTCSRAFLRLYLIHELHRHEAAAEECQRIQTRFLAESDELNRLLSIPCDCRTPQQDARIDHLLKPYAQPAADALPVEPESGTRKDELRREVESIVQDGWIATEQRRAQQIRWLLRAAGVVTAGGIGWWLGGPHGAAIVFIIVGGSPLLFIRHRFIRFYERRLERLRINSHDEV